MGIGSYIIKKVMVSDSINKLEAFEDKHKLVSSSEAASLLGVGTSTIKRWVDAGHLKARKTLGGHRRISILALLEIARKTTARNQPQSESSYTSSAKAHTNKTSKAPFNILIVDDDKDILAVLATYIRSKFPRIKVHTAVDGFRAGILVGRNKPRIVFTDIRMPRLNGIEVCKMIKSESDLASTRVIGITASQDQSELEAMKNAGADAVLLKPLRFLDLETIIESELLI
ncbi:MAG: response regulator [Candidatus Lindowbacteria bacterium]|nr:response regulator [Candidatus Lindowbacteria bacterium]